MRPFLKDPVLVNLAVMAGISVMQALQLLVAMAVVSQLIHIPLTPFVQKIFPVYLSDVRPEREMTLYRFFVVAAIGIQAAWVYVWRQRLHEPGLYRRWLPYAGITAFWIFLELMAAFKWLVWGHAAWRGWLWLCVGLAALCQVFYPEVRKYVQQQAKILEKGIEPRWLDVAVVIVLILLVWPGRWDEVYGRMLVHDQFYHLDSLIMAPGWAHLKGLVLNWDVISQYSNIIPILWADVLNVFKMWSYESAVKLVVGVCLGYWVALYFFLRGWLQSRWWAFFAVLLVVKLQMFHWGVAPLVWQYPSATPLRHVGDVIFFWVLWRHIQTQRRVWLVALGAVCGVVLATMIDVGVYLTAAYLVYLLWLHLRNRKGPVGLLVGCAILVPAVALICLWLVQPSAVFSRPFWGNMFEFSALFLQGWGALPMTHGLLEKQFFAFVLGFLFPVFYVWTLVYLGIRQWRGQTPPEDLFAVIVSLYGLGLHHYFIYRSGVTSYDAVCVPWVMLGVFWMARGVRVLKKPWLRVTPPALVLLMLGVFVTTYWFAFYPNAFGIKDKVLQQEAQYFHQNFDFSQDARLITSRTSANEPTALISSFETKILMQADRAPFFYYFPLMESSLMDSKQVRSTYLHTQERLHKTLASLEAKRPKFIFVEEKLLRPTQETGLAALLNYVKAHYTAGPKGQYLVAFERND